MSQLTSMFCQIDDFCKGFEPTFERHLLQSGARQRRRKPGLALSEVMTLLVHFHQSGYRTFKAYYTEYVRRHLKGHFPKLVSYSRFVELVPRALVPLTCYLHSQRGRTTGLAFVDSTPLAVCPKASALASTASSPGSPSGARPRWGGSMGSSSTSS